MDNIFWVEPLRKTIVKVAFYRLFLVYLKKTCFVHDFVILTVASNYFSGNNIIQYQLATETFNKQGRDISCFLFMCVFFLTLDMINILCLFYSNFVPKKKSAAEN